MPPHITRPAGGRRGPAATTCPPDVAPLLGTMTDRDVANLARVSTATVFRWRNEAGVPPFDRRGAKDVHEAKPNAALREMMKEVLREAQPAAGGMLISHANYAKLCAVLFGE